MALTIPSWSLSRPAAGLDELALTDAAGYTVGPGYAGLGPVDVDQYADQPAGWPGEVARGVRVLARTVLVPITVHGYSAGDVAARRDALYRYASPIPDRGRTDPALTVTVARPDGTVRRITGRPTLVESTGDGDVGDLHATAVLTVRCASPWWEDVDESRLAFAIGTPPKPFLGSVPFLPVKLASSQVLGQASVIVDGTVDVQPVWEVTGPGAGLVATSRTLGRSWAVSGAIPAGDVWTIDTRRGYSSLTDRAGVNLWPRVTARDLWPLVPGRNDLTLTLTGTTAASLVVARYRHQWQWV